MDDRERLLDHFYDDDEFEDTLSSAEDKAVSEFEINFTSSLRQKFDEYGEDMFLSSRQADILQTIANK